MQYGQLKYMQEEWSGFTSFPEGCSVGHRTPDQIDNGCSSADSLQIVPAHGEPTGEYFSKTERPAANTRLKSLHHLNASHVFSSCFFKVSEVFNVVFLC